ncbi:MAG TPA: MFS transporter [bacterium]|nr:MFS transporter [bacterium]
MNEISKKYRNYRIRSFTILWFVYAGFYLTRKNYAVSKAGIMDSFGLNEAQIGWIGGAYLAIYALGQFINGMLGDKLGSRIMLSLGMLGSAVMSLCFGFTPSLILLVLVWGTNGYMQSTGWSNSVKSMSQWFSVKERGVIMGLWCTCYQIGSAIATLIAAYVLGKYGWQSAFTIPAVMLIIIAVVYILFHKDTPESVGLPPISEYHNETEKQNDSSQTESEENRESVIKEVLSHPMVWMMGLSYFCLKFVRYSLMFWLPLYMTKQLGYEPQASGYLSTVPEIAGFLGVISAGLISDKLMGSRRAPVCVIMFFGLAIACLFQTKLCVMGIVPMVIGLSIIGFMTYGPDSIMTGAAAMDFGTRKGAATAAGFINGCGSVGAAIQEPLLGYFAVKFGYDYFFYIFIILAIIPGILMLTQWNAKPKEE